MRAGNPPVGKNEAMGRPLTPLIDRDEAIAKALEIIDQQGAEALTIRKLGRELGVNGASLYHHFKDKEAILDGVRALVLKESGAILRGSKSATWQDYVTKSIDRYRTALLRHPNAAPLMTPLRMSVDSQTRVDYVMGKMVEDGVPEHLTYAIIDSVENLAFGSAVTNPLRQHPNERLEDPTSEAAPNLKASIRSGYADADKLFRLELEALLQGWTTLIEREHNKTSAARSRRST